MGGVCVILLHLYLLQIWEQYQPGCQALMREKDCRFVLGGCASLPALISKS